MLMDCSAIQGSMTDQQMVGDAQRLRATRTHPIASIASRFFSIFSECAKRFLSLVFRSPISGLVVEIPCFLLHPPLLAGFRPLVIVS